MRRRLIPLAAFLLLLPLQAAAVEAAKMRQLLALMGFDVAVAATAPGLKSAKQGIAGRTPAFDDIWDRTVDQLFAPEILFNAQAEAVAPIMDETEWQTLMAYFTEGLGARVTEMENAAQRPAGQAEKDALGDRLVDRLKTENPERIAQIEELLTALSAEEQTLAHAMNMSYAMILGLASTGQIPALGEKLILEMLQAQAPAMRANIRASAFRSNAYIYRDLSNEEMAEYIAFLSADPARKLYAALHTQSAILMPALVRKLGQTVMERLGEQEL